MFVERQSPSTHIHGLNDFLLFQAYRLWMEYPSRDLDESRPGKSDRTTSLGTRLARLQSPTSETRPCASKIDTTPRSAKNPLLCAAMYRHLQARGARLSLC